MRLVLDPIVRICDVALKGLVVLPLLTAVLYALSGNPHNYREFLEYMAFTEQFVIFLLVLLTIGYGTWSAVAVCTMRRKAEHSLWWALAASVIWVVGMPGFARGLRRSAETEGKANLHAIRAALSLYHRNEKAKYPASLDSLIIGGKYLVELPNTRLPNYHNDTARVVIGKSPDDSGGWLYVSDPRDAKYGSVTVNCTHTDTRGTAWSSY